VEEGMSPTSNALSVQPLRALSPRTRRLLRRALLVLLIALPCIALADPPSWAPAHGWRKQHDPYYAGYSGRQWQDDYGVRDGRCDRAEVGAVLGSVAGGVVGAEIAKDGQLAVAVALGTVIGAAIGAEIGRRMDQADRSCVGHALELSETGRTVTWTNPNTVVSYRLTPTAEADGPSGCRKFRLTATGSFGLSEGRTVACPSADGTWTLSPDVRIGRR
jgi:surface antigen